MALSLTSAVTLTSYKTSTASGGQFTTDTYSISLRTAWTDGSGVGSANKVYSPGQVTLGGSPDTYDLSGALTDKTGASAVFGTIMLFFAQTPSTNTGTITFGGGSNPWNQAFGTITLPPGCQYGPLQCTTASGWKVTAGTGDILQVSGTNGDKYEFYVAGS